MSRKYTNNTETSVETVACIACTFLNPLGTVYCSMCRERVDQNESGPGHSVRDSSVDLSTSFGSSIEGRFYQDTQNDSTRENSWICSICTLHNRENDSFCSACNQERDATTAQSYTDTFRSNFVGNLSEDIPYGRNNSSPGGMNLTIIGGLIGLGAGYMTNRNITESTMTGLGLGTLADLLLQQFTEPELGSRDTHIRETSPFIVTTHSLHQQYVESIIDSMPSYSFKQSGSATSQCSICLENYDDNEIVKTLPCLHNYHGKCIDQWLRRSATCPVCKKPVQ